MIGNSDGTSARVRFAGFEFDCETNSLSRGGVPLKLEPQPAKLLRELLLHPGEIVTREQLCCAVWGSGTFVDFEQGVNYCIRRVRLALDDPANSPRFIETLPRQGYRFVGALDGSIQREVSTAAPPPRRRIMIWAAVAIVLVAGISGWRWRARTISRNRVNSIAVLPVVNATGDPATEYIADGATDTLIRQLSGIPNLKVMARATVFRFKGKEKDARSIARTLGVNSVVTAQLRQEHDRLVMDVELSDVNEGTVIFSRQYLPDVTNLMPVQADLLKDVLTALHVDPRSHGADQHLTSSPAAYQLFLRGEYSAQRQSPENLQKAIDYYQQAVQLDPGFTLAWTQLAQAHLLLGIFFDAPRQQMPAARDCAMRALKLDNSNEDARASLGLVSLVYDWNQPAAESALGSPYTAVRAITTFSCSAHLMGQSGRLRNGEELLRYALSYDPQSTALTAELGCNAYYRRQYDQALQYYREAVKVDGLAPLPYWGVGKSLSGKQMYREAVENLLLFKTRNGFEPSVITAELGYAYARWGKTEEALSRIDQLKENAKSAYMDPYLTAIIYLGMNDRDQAFSWLEKAFSVKSAFLISLASEPKWDDLRTDSRFEAMLGRIGLPAAEIAK